MNIWIAYLIILCWYLHKKKRSCADRNNYIFLIWTENKKYLELETWISPKLFGPSLSKDLSKSSDSARILINEDGAWITVFTKNKKEIFKPYLLGGPNNKNWILSVPSTVLRKIKLYEWLIMPPLTFWEVLWNYKIFYTISKNTF